MCLHAAERYLDQHPDRSRHQVSIGYDYAVAYAFPRKVRSVLRLLRHANVQRSRLVAVPVFPEIRREYKLHRARLDQLVAARADLDLELLIVHVIRSALKVQMYRIHRLIVFYRHPSYLDCVDGHIRGLPGQVLYLRLLRLFSVGDAAAPLEAAEGVLSAFVYLPFSLSMPIAASVSSLSASICRSGSSSEASTSAS